MLPNSADTSDPKAAWLTRIVSIYQYSELREFLEDDIARNGQGQVEARKIKDSQRFVSLRASWKVGQQVGA